MTVLSTEIQFFKPQEVSDAATNGGRVSFLEIVTATAQNVFGHAFSAERAAGSTKYRKIATRINNDDDETLYNTLARLFMPTLGEDAVAYALGTARDTQADASAYTYEYGPATLNTAVTAGGSTLILDCETSELATNLGPVGSLLFISDQTTWGGSGNIEQHTVATRSVSGSQLTVTLDSTTLANDFAAWDGSARTGGHVAFAPAGVDVAASIDNTSSTFAGDGALDFNQVLADAIGTAELTISGSFSDATTYTLTVDDTTHSLGSGSTSSDFAPLNPANSKPYLTIPAAAWSGTIASGDTFGMQSHPPCLYVWERRIIPAACGSLAGNQVVLVVQGESA